MAQVRSKVTTDPTMHSLPPALAQEIATDLGATVGLHVLITDREGGSSEAAIPVAWVSCTARP